MKNCFEYCCHDDWRILLEQISLKQRKTTDAIFWRREKRETSLLRILSGMELKQRKYPLVEKLPRHVYFPEWDHVKVSVTLIDTH